MRQLFVRMAVSIFLFALPLAHAQWAVQMSPQDFLKPHTYTHAAIDNYGPVMGSSYNPAKTYRVVCTQTNAQTISCRTVAETLPSGGGKWYGPWYWIAPEPAPTGYKFQSASFTVPQRDPSGKPVSAPDHCYGDDNSTIQPPNSKPENPYKGGNPDTQWVGHKNGGDHGWSVCFIQREDANGPKWLYNLQGQEGGYSVSIFPFAGSNPFTGDDNWIKIEQRKDGTVSEPAELDVVYVKAITESQGIRREAVAAHSEIAEKLLWQELALPTLQHCQTDTLSISFPLIPRIKLRTSSKFGMAISCFQVRALAMALRLAVQTARPQVAIARQIHRA